MSKNTTEIERKYIAKIVGPILVHEVVMSIQGYIAVYPKWEWRIRKLVREDDSISWYTAIKTGNGLVRREFEWKIPALLGGFLMWFAPKPLVKQRTSSHGWEIDEFFEPPWLSGLILAEAEIEDASHPMPPHPSGIELIEDVTEHGGYSNKHLYRYGRPKKTHTDSFRRPQLV